MPKFIHLLINDQNTPSLWVRADHVSLVQKQPDYMDGVSSLVVLTNGMAYHVLESDQTILRKLDPQPIGDWELNRGVGTEIPYTINQGN